MFGEARGTRIWYEVSGRADGSPVVLLHGWGASSVTMASIAACLNGDHRVYTLDFPGFGQSAPPPTPWSVGDYTEALRELLASWGVQRAAFIGHSFGGRVAIKLAVLSPQVVDRLVLVDAAGVPPRRSARDHATAAVARVGKAVFSLPGLAAYRATLQERVAQRLGSSDYAAAGPQLRETFVRVINEDLTPLLGRIQASTLLVWGDADQDTPLSAGQLMEREIPDAGLVVLSPAGHYSFVDKPAEFCAAVRYFLSTDLTAPPPPAAASPRPNAPRRRATPRSTLSPRRLTALVGGAVVGLLLLVGVWLVVARLGVDALWAAALVAAAAPWLLHGLRRAISYLHVLQLEEYETRRYLAWLGGRRARLVTRRDLIGGLILLVSALACAPLRDSALALVAPLGALGLTGLYALLATHPATLAKKPLVYTRKAQLILLLSAGVGGLFAVLIVALGLALAVDSVVPRLYATLCAAMIGAWLAAQAAALLVVAGNAALYPAQAAAKRRVVRRATAKLRARPDLLVVGVSGTYGKTSVKEILATILEGRYRVLKTPESYNTLLGISGVVLRDLRPDHEVFVCEMGSYGPGDVAALCRIAPPRVGILTSVGVMHLERFKTVEAIARTDYELIQALPPAGVAVFNADDEWCRRLAGETQGPRVVRAGSGDQPGVDLWASEIATTAAGISFTVHDVTGAAAPFQVGLLGRHNVGNVLLATAAALACGMSLSEVARAVGRVRPVAHRLQLIPGAVTTIDDTYNANPQSVAAGLAVLDEMPGRHKVLVTPGMVELGPREAEENRAFGRRAAAICDTVILVGPRRTRPIQEGLREQGFPAEQTVVVRTFDEARAQFTRLLRPGDVLLMTNDLPDQYDE